MRASTLGEAATLLVGMVDAGAADDRVRPLAEGLRTGAPLRPRGADADRPELRDRIAPYRAGYTVEQRRHDRARPGRGPAAGGRVHQRARAGARHRRARLRDRRRLPGRDGQPPPAVGPGRSPRSRPRPDGRRRGPARPVPGPPRRRAARPADRGRRLQPREPGGAGRPPALRGGRAAADRRRPPALRRRRDGARGIAARPGPGPAGLVYSGADHPAAGVPLRSASADAIAIVEGGTGTLLGLVDGARADSTVHEGAIYLHLGEQYLVRALDHSGRVALVGAVRRRLLHPGTAPVGDHRAGGGDGARAGRRARLPRPDRGARTGGRLPA